MALAAGFGGFVGLRRPRDYPGGVRSLGYYFGKYLLKDYGRTMGGVVKLVTSSVAWKAGRGFSRRGRWGVRVSGQAGVQVSQE